MATLPDEARPIWCEVFLTTEYEKYSLPLLFATDSVFAEYYDTLSTRLSEIETNSNSATTTHNAKSVAMALADLRSRNVQGKHQRASGYWRECLESLRHCVQMRHAIFGADHYQYTAARTHYVCTLLNFAVFFLKEGSAPGTHGAQSDGMLVRAYEVFHNVETELKEIASVSARHDIATMLHSNYARYFHRRKKNKAASQRTLKALQAWQMTKRTNPVVTAALKLLDATARLSCGSYEETVRILKAIVGEKAPPVMAALTEAGGGGSGVMEITCHVVLHGAENDGITADQMMSLFQLVAHHNLAAAYVGTRRYDKALSHSTMAMEAITTGVTVGGPPGMSHTVNRLHEYCGRMCAESTYATYRMKSSEYITSDAQNLKAFIATTMKLPHVDAVIEMQKQLDARARLHKEKKQRLRDEADSALPSALTAQLYIPSTTSKNPPKRPTLKDHIHKGVAMPKTTSYAQLVQDYASEIEKYQKFVTGEKGRASASPRRVVSPTKRTNKKEDTQVPLPPLSVSPPAAKDAKGSPVPPMSPDTFAFSPASTTRSDSMSPTKRKEEVISPVSTARSDSVSPTQQQRAGSVSPTKRKEEVISPASTARSRSVSPTEKQRAGSVSPTKPKEEVISPVSTPVAAPVAATEKEEPITQEPIAPTVSAKRTSLAPVVVTAAGTGTAAAPIVRKYNDDDFKMSDDESDGGGGAKDRGAMDRTLDGVSAGSPTYSDTFDNESVGSPSAAAKK